MKYNKVTHLIIPRTPRMHETHYPSDIKPCDCSFDRADDSIVCVCGAAYNKKARTFPIFTCYDCGAVLYRVNGILMAKV